MLPSDNMFLQLPYLFAGLLAGLIIGSVSSPPTRKVPKAPTPNDQSVYRTETGCVRVRAVEVACPYNPDSLNLLGAQHK